MKKPFASDLDVLKLKIMCGFESSLFIQKNTILGLAGVIGTDVAYKAHSSFKVS